jgi:hypothetical protein
VTDYKIERVLNDAEAFLEDAEQASRSDDQDFSEVRRYFKSFITTARSVTWAMKKEFSDKEGFEEWYNDKIQILGEQGEKFKELRNEIEKEGESPLGVVLKTDYRGGFVTGLDGAGNGRGIWIRRNEDGELENFLFLLPHPNGTLNINGTSYAEHPCITNKRRYLAVMNLRDGEKRTELPEKQAFEEAREYLENLSEIVNECIERFGDNGK